MTEVYKNVTEDEDSLKDRFLTFITDKETYGIEIKHVTEIVGIQTITAMPETPDYIIGVINLRGRIIPVVDVRVRFNKPTKDYNDRTCVIVIAFGDVSYGLIVDSVSEVIKISDEDIVDKLDIRSKGSRGYISGIGKSGSQLVLLLDCQRLLSSEELNIISEQMCG
jgi:Chemotaxis signal transduction protein